MCESKDKSGSEERDQGCKEITHSGSMIQQENQNRVIISQPAISLAYLFAAAVLLSTEI